MTDTHAFDQRIKEIIWHMSCGQCGYYWTVPTMREDDDPTHRAWTCPLCATKVRLNGQTVEGIITVRL